jgi:NADH-ubiquinone oxidoreductase chain 2
VKYQYDIDGDTYLSTINDPRNDKRYNNITLEAVENGPRFIHRITIVLLVYAIYLSLNVLYYYSILYIKDGIGIYNGLFQFSQINGTFEVFMLILSVIILSITSYNYSCKNHKYGTINYKDNDINIENNTENNTDDNINNNINTNNNNTEKEASLKSLGSSYIYNTINTKILTGHLSSVYPLLILLNLLGALMFMKNIDLISMYITIELQSFALYIISSINRNNQLSVKSGLTYFLLGGLSSTFILLGSALIYSSTCLTSLENIYIIHSLISNDFISQS